MLTMRGVEKLKIFEVSKLSTSLVLKPQQSQITDTLVTLVNIKK